MRLNRRTALKGGLYLAASSLAAPAVFAQPAPIRIGVTVPLSGAQAQPGVGFLTGVESCANLANAAGGVLGRQIELVIRDDEGTAAGSVAAGRELFDSNVNLLVGAFQSQLSLALAPILEEAKAVLIGDGTAMSLTHESFTRHFFRGYSNANMNYGGLGRAVATKFPEVRNWSGVCFDTAFGRDGIAAFARGFGAVTGEPIDVSSAAFVAPTAADFKIEISKLISAGVEGIYLGMLGGPAITFLQQARAMGLTERLKVIAEAGSDTLIGKSMQRDTPTNIWGRGFWYPERPEFIRHPLSQQLYDDIVARTGNRYPDSIGQAGHKALTGMLKGIEKADSTETEAVIAALEGLEFDTAEGKTTFRKEDHQSFGLAHYGTIGPSDTEPFYAVRDVVVIDELDIIEPATPGVAFKP